MANARLAAAELKQIPSTAIFRWRIIQYAVWVVGAAILFCLLFFPSLGIVLFWDILIPVAPALLVVAAGFWRNVCPLASVVLLPRHFGLSKRKKLSVTQQGKLNLAAVVSLYTIVPLRHALFNSNGVATGLLIILLVLTGIILGVFYDWKSAWCSGLCPVHPVEKLYGANTVVSLPNAHCDKCFNCVIPCPDSTPNIRPNASKKSIYHKLGALLIIGGLPGFIWGWFHVPDAATLTTPTAFFSVFVMPMAGLAATLVLYCLMAAIVKPSNDRWLTNIFAASAVSCYYWYRVPALFGFGCYVNNGLLVNLKNTLPPWSIICLAALLVIFFFYWLVFRRQNKKSWIIRPEFANVADRN